MRITLVTLALLLAGLWTLTGGCPQGFSIFPGGTTGNGSEDINDDSDDTTDDADNDTDDGTGDDTDDDADGSDDDADDTDDDSAQEVPEFLPSSVTLDISELPEESDTGDLAKTSRAAPQDPPNPFDRVVRASATIVHRFHKLADRALELGAQIRADMEDPNQTQVEGTYRLWGAEVAYKADFAAFDIDGDGTADGSGNAYDEPVALRVWTDLGEGYQQFLCALITTRPSEENLGAGQMYLHPSHGDPYAPQDAQVFVEYDRTAEEHKWNQAYVFGRIHPLYGVHNGVARVDVRTDAEGAVEKTVRAAHEFVENPYGFETFQSAAHYLLGGTGMLLSGSWTGTDAQLSFTNICVSLAERALAIHGECDDFDTQDMTLLDVPTGGESDFPADFPEEPTF